MLYGHKHPVPAPGVPGECYALVGAKFVAEEPAPEAAATAAAGSRAKILDEDDEDYTNIREGGPILCNSKILLNRFSVWNVLKC